MLCILSILSILYVSKEVFQFYIITRHILYYQKTFLLILTVPLLLLPIVHNNAYLKDMKSSLFELKFFNAGILDATGSANLIVLHLIIQTYLIIIKPFLWQSKYGTLWDNLIWFGKLSDRRLFVKYQYKFDVEGFYRMSSPWQGQANYSH